MQKKIILSVLVVAFLIGGGVLVWQKKMTQTVSMPEENKEEMKSVETSGWRVQQSEVKTFEPVVNERGYVWFPVSELGIEIKVKSGIAEELVYQTREREGVVSAQFTTKKLMEIGEKLYGASFAKDGDYECSLGSFVTYQMTSDSFKANEKYEYMRNHGTDIGNVFVAYYSIQSPCVLGTSGTDDVSSDGKYEQSIIGSWWGKPTSLYTETWGPMENIKESVRGIR